VKRLVSALLGCALIGLFASQGESAQPASGPTLAQASGVQLKNHNFTPENLRRVHKLGFRVVRKGFYWSSVEKEQGVYAFGEYDAAMEEAKRLGLTVVGCLFGGNKLYEDDGQGGIQTEEGRRGFADFAAALAGRFKDHDVVWEVWNEPNVRSFWRKDGKHNSDEFAAEYTALVREVAPAMQQVDADCFVVAGSVSNYWEPSYEWTESCFQKGILKSGIRGWSVHPYGVKTPEEFAVGHQRMRQLLKKYTSPDLPLFDTERGFAVKERPEGWSGGELARAREYQAWHLVRQFLIDRMCGVQLTVWYQWDGAEFGIVDEKGTRPALAACRAMLAQLGDYRFVRRLEAENDLDYLLLFENDEGRSKLVAWTAPPPGGTPDEAEEHAVAVEIVEAWQAADLQGNAKKVHAVTGTLPLVLSGAPQYVTLPEGIVLGRAVVPHSSSSDQKSNGPASGDTNLALFAEGAPWEFIKNTGEGSFTLDAADGEPIGVLHYDFTRSKSKSTPYVLAAAPVDIREGAEELQLQARSAIPLRLTFRVVDSTGQTHQFKSKISEPDQWETIHIPLTKRLEHWGGAADGKIHFPIKQLVFSVPLPGEDAKEGQVEYAEVKVLRANR
jgi:hypothetical protein